jgi:CHRD domain-containing protein
MQLRLFAVLAAVVLVPATALAASEKGNSLHATLRGTGEVPKGDLDGSGTAEVKITGTRVCWEFKLAKIGAPNAAHIHKGLPGKAGPVVVPFGKTYKAKSCTTAPAAVTRAILNNPGAYYVNVHNARYPGGAVRGQLRSDN